MAKKRSVIAKLVAYGQEVGKARFKNESSARSWARAVGIGVSKPARKRNRPKKTVVRRKRSKRGTRRRR